jgi:hypothetical protein
MAHAPAGEESPRPGDVDLRLAFTLSCAKGLSGVVLILSSRGVVVLLDFETGAASQADDLRVSLEGSAYSDRDCNVAQTSLRFSGPATLDSEDGEGVELDSL